AASGDAPLSYQWYLGSVALGQGTNATLTFTNAQASQAGGYSVVVANPVGRATSQVAVLTVRIPPLITQQPVSLVVTQGASGGFSLAAGGDAPLSYQWYLGSAPVGPGTNATLTLTNAQAGQAGNYAVVVANPVGRATSQVAVLTVRVPP